MAYIDLSKKVDSDRKIYDPAAGESPSLQAVGGVDPATGAGVEIG